MLLLGIDAFWYKPGLHPLFLLEDILLFSASATIISGIEYIGLATVRRFIHRRWQIIFLVAVLVEAGFAPFILKAFSGPGVMRSVWGVIGPPIGFAIMFAGGIILAILLLTLEKRPGFIAAFFGAAAVVLTGIDLNIMSGLYTYLHALTALLTVLSAGLSITSLFVATGFGFRLRKWAPAVSVILIAIPYFTLLNTDKKRLTASKTHYTTMLVDAHRKVMDFDGDGYSAILGGGDTDDLDSSRVFSGSVRIRKGRCPAPGTRTFSNAPVIFITVDALRYDVLTSPGDWPNFKKLYNEGIRFKNAYAPASMTGASFPILYTGCYGPGGPDCRPFVRQLRDMGYDTAVASSAILTDSLRSTKGLGSFARYFKDTDKIPDQFQDKLLTTVTKRRKSRWGFGLDEFQGDRITENALKWIKAHKDRRFFIWIHYFDVHQWMFLGDKDYMSAWNNPVPAYKKSLARLDRAIGPLVSFLDKSGLRKKAIVILGSDHGEGLGYKGFHTHTKWIYNVLVHIPLSISLPGVRPGELNTPVGLVDMNPTLLRLLTGKPPAKTDGCDVSGIITGGDRNTQRNLYFIADSQVGVLDYPYKLNFQFIQNIATLFDVRSDPLETKDLSKTLPSRKNQLTKELLWFMSKEYPAVFR